MAKCEFVNTGAYLQSQDSAHDQVINGLFDFYTKTLLPIEQAISFEQFQSTPITEGEMRSPPMVLLVGPYSVGKTSFIRYLIGKDIPGQNIGPEPTTDRFVAVMHGAEERVVPGNTLAVAPLSPFEGLQVFGNGFLTRFEGAVVNSDLLKAVTLIDTPGILSGAKHRDRSYDPDVVMKWFAERCDMIILLVDVHKLDFSDELAGVVQILHTHADKVRVALNKSDAVAQQQLMRVYGAVMWSLAKVLGTPEVCRVYLGSFWENPPSNADTSKLLKAEMEDMIRDLCMLPRQSAVRKVNEIVKRSRKVRLLACLLDYLRSEMPKLGSADKKKTKLLADIDGVCAIVCKKYQLSTGDFPSADVFLDAAARMDFSKFPALKGKRLQHGKLLEELANHLSSTIPGLLELLPATGQCGNKL